MERKDLIALMEEERQQVSRAEELVAKQEALVQQLSPEYPEAMVRRANRVLAVLRDSLEVGRKRLARLEAQLARQP